MLARCFVSLKRKLRLAGANTLRKKEAIRVKCVCAAGALRGFVGVPVAAVVLAIRVQRPSLITIFVDLLVTVEGF